MQEKMTQLISKFWLDPKGHAKLAGLYSSPFFWGVLIIKVIAGCFFLSPHLSGLFLPFLDVYIHNPNASPYAHFFALSKPESFPYPALMLYIMAAPRLIVQTLITGATSLPTPALLFLYHLPLLIADLGILFTLVRWLPSKTKHVLWLYWASPVLFYITYMHGQLDVVPIAFLFAAFYCLFKDKYACAAITLGLGLATKTNLAIAIPFFFIYLWRRQESIKPCIAFGILMLLGFVVPNIGYLRDPIFLTMVFNNAPQHKLTQASISFSNGSDYYLIFGVYLFLLFRALQIRIQNRDLFLMFLGFSFGSLLFFVEPMPGWYYWIIPFLAYFFTRNGGKQFALLAALQIAYLIYFGMRPDSDYQDLLFTGINASDAAVGATASPSVNVAYTLLQTLLLINCFWLYRHGIRAYQKYKLTARSFLIGISGDSGSGKTSLATTIEQFFTPRNVTVVCGDDMHKWQRGDEKWQKMTHLDPKANELHQELDYLTALRQYRTIYRRHYDHNTGRFTDALPIRPKPIVIMEGLHSFYLKPARDLLDLKIFIQPDKDLLIHRKVARDMAQRNHSREKIIETIEQRSEDAEKYIKVQHKNADLIIAQHPTDSVQDISAAKEPSYWLEIIASNAFYFDPLISELASELGDGLRHYYASEDRQVIELHKPASAAAIERCGENLLSGLLDFGVYAPVWKEGHEGFMQLVMAWCIFAGSRRATSA